MAYEMPFPSVWAENSPNLREPTVSELDQGFECGAAGLRELHNFLFQDAQQAINALSLGDGRSDIPVNGWQSAPPGAPAEGDRYVVLPAGTGAWAGHDNEIAIWTGAAWAFSSPLSGLLVQYMSAGIYTPIYFDGTVWKKRDATENEVRDAIGTGAVQARWLTYYARALKASITYYVRTTGNDSNGGLTAGDAFLTIQKAIEAGSALIGGAFSVYIDVGAGQFSPYAVSFGSGNSYEVIGVGTDAATGTRINGAGAEQCALAGDNGRLIVRSQRMFSGTTALVRALYGGKLQYADIAFGIATGASHILAGPMGRVISLGAYQIVGGANRHIEAGGGSYLQMQHLATLTGTPGFTGEFARCLRSSMQLTGSSFSGAATGKRYTADQFGVINTSGAGATFLPGDAAGTTGTGSYI